jgi:hypothetical protein
MRSSLLLGCCSVAAASHAWAAVQTLLSEMLMIFLLGFGTMS